MVGQGPVAMGGPWVATALGRRGAVGIVPYAATRPARSPGRPSSATIARPCQNRRPVSRHATTPATTAARAGLANDRFRPDLEGLRAVAILLVLLYHAHVPGFGGGFVGVDVFFVISGFLITGILVRDLDATGTISLGAFYARRSRSPTSLATAWRPACTSPTSGSRCRPPTTCGPARHPRRSCTSGRSRSRSSSTSRGLRCCSWPLDRWGVRIA